MKNKQNLTEGNLWSQMLWFSLPLIIGSFFQQFYNTVDTIIVGQVLGTNALAAVGASTNIINMLIGFFVGISTGATVVVANYFGAGDIKGIHKAVHTTFFMTIILGVFLTALGYFASPIILRAIGVPEEVFQNAVTYLQIFSLGMIPAVFYNMASAILRAVGDSRRPLLFLIVASLTNVVLDIVFIYYLDMGIAGAGWATAIAQLVSAVLVCNILLKTNEPYRLNIKDIVPDKNIVKRIITIGLPGGVQMIITSFSNIAVQGYISNFNAAAIAGFGAYLKLDSLIFLPAQSLSLAVVTFVGQNLGAKNVKRAKESIRNCWILTLTISVILSSVVYVVGGDALKVFTSEPEVLAYGEILIKIMVPFHWALAMCLIYAGAMRGIGEGLPPMIVMIGCFVVLRQIYLFVVTKYINTYEVIAYGYAVTWIISGFSMYFWYKFYKWEKKYSWIKDI